MMKVKNYYQDNCLMTFYGFEKIKEYQKTIAFYKFILYYRKLREFSSIDD